MRQRKRLHFSLFERVIVLNSILLIGEALLGLWVTSHNLESHHYLIDTAFLVTATVASLLINIFLLRASFHPLFSLLTTIRKIASGKTSERATMEGDAEIGELARAFNGMLDRLEEAQREQSMLILQAQEQERQRFARELHDETSQNLTALLVHTEVLNQHFQLLSPEKPLGEVQEQVMAEVKQLVDLAQRTLENTRLLAQQLRPAVLDDLGLQAALRWLVEDSQQRLHLPVMLTIDEKIAMLSLENFPLYETTLFRIAQESLTNVARHAQAQRVQLSLTMNERHLILRIYDDGHGFDVSQSVSGLGIRGMRERANLLNGTLMLQSQPGKGTAVLAALPLPEGAEKEAAYD